MQDATQANPTPALDSRAILSIGEAAEYLGVSRRFIELEVQRGHLAVVRLSTRCLRIRRSALETYLTARTATA
jgi:excisionase family DNA binding protein